MIVGIEATHANKPQKTGVENYCWQIIQNLKKEIPADVKVVLYSNTSLSDELGNLPANLPAGRQGWSVKILPWPFKKMWSQIRLSLELLFHPPDIFFAPGQLVPFFCPKKTVSMIHDSAFLAFPSAYHFWGRQYLKWMNKRVIKASALILTSSEFNKKELIKYYRADKNKIKVIPLAYNKETYKIISPPQNNLPQPYIIAIGRLEEKKNTVQIVRVFNLLKSDPKNSKLQLILAGKPGVGYAEVKKEIDGSSYKADIKEMGFVSDIDLIALLNSAVAFVFPSLYEGFGIPVLEAMACGCPVVVSNRGSLSEIAGDAALYAEANDAGDISNKINQILNDSNLRTQLIKKGLERANRFNWENTAKQTWQALSLL